MVHLRAGAHHEVILAEAYAALGAFDPVQPEWTGPGMGREAHKKRVISGRFWPNMASDPGHKSKLPEKKNSNSKVGQSIETTPLPPSPLLFLSLLLP